MQLSSESGSSPFLAVPFYKRLIDHVHHCTIIFKNHSEIILSWRCHNTVKRHCSIPRVLCPIQGLPFQERHWGAGAWRRGMKLVKCTENNIWGCSWDSWGVWLWGVSGETLFLSTTPWKEIVARWRSTSFPSQPDRRRGSGLKMWLEMFWLDI